MPSRHEITLEQLIVLFPGHLYWKNLDGVYLGCNDEMARYLGYESAQEIVGKTDADWNLQEGLAELRAKDLAIIQTDCSATFEENVVLRDGSLGVFLTKKTPYHDENGKVIGIVGVSFNITERKRQEQELQEARLRAESSNQAKSNFLATLSHELRTPLNGIIGVAQLFAKQSLSDIQREYLDDIYQSGLSMLRLVNDVLDFTKLELGTLQLEDDEFSLSSIIEDAVSNISFQVNSNNVEIGCQIDSSVPNYACGDSLRFKQVLLNLLGNANKFTDKGNITLKAFADKPKKGHFNLHVTITDTGIGIPSEMLEKIFDRFTQVQSSYSRRYPGTGLGLAICKQLVELMGGDISASSELGKGSSFQFCIPFAVSDPKNRVRSGKAYLLPDKNAQKKKYPLRVLLVEDIALNRKVATYMLHDLGCTVETAEDAASAIRMIKQNQYDIIFMDIGLPDKSGMDVTREMRKKHLPSEFPIIAMTAHAMEDDLQKCLDAGMNQVITKPVLENDIEKVLEHWFGSPRV